MQNLWGNITTEIKSITSIISRWITTLKRGHDKVSEKTASTAKSLENKREYLVIKWTYTVDWNNTQSN